MMVSLVGSGLVYLAMTQATTLPQWAILMVVMGALGPLFRVGSNAMVADLIPPDDRASAYALLRMSNNLGIAIGPAIGGFIAAVSYSRAFMAAVTGYLLFALLLWFMVSETLTKTQESTRGDLSGSGYGRLLQDRSFLAFCGIVTLAVIPASIMMVLLPVYAKEQFGVIESQYGFIMAANAAMVVLFQYGVTQITKRFPSLLVMAVGALLYGVGVGSVALGASFLAFLLSMIIMTLGELIMVPTGTTLAANLSPPDMRGRYMGIYGLTWGVGFGIGPALGGFLNDSIAPAAIWYGALAFGLLATAGFLILRRRVGEPGQEVGLTLAAD
jgi:MFS family permease